MCASLPDMIRFVCKWVFVKAPVSRVKRGPKMEDVRPRQGPCLGGA